MFVSRETELMALQKLYDKQTFQMVVMYGRRRVGKTTLINEFIKDKPAIFFSAQEANEKMNLQMFSAKVYSFFDLPETTGAFVNWNDAFMFIADRAKSRQFILAIDEFPYIAETNKSVKSILQNIIDHHMKNTGLYLILCGSQVGFMEREVLGYKSPLFGRRTAQFCIESFDYYDCAKMLPHASNEDKMRYYASVGGTPHYLSQIDSNLTFEDNIKSLFFKPQGFLYSEPTMLLQQELREPAMYNSIIAAIATGSSRLNEISTKIGEDSSKTIKYIKTLVDLKILQKVIPFGDNPERSKKGIYSISEQSFRFWYRFVFLNKTSVESGLGAEVADSVVFPELPAFVGKSAFESACRQYILRRNKDRSLPFITTNIGCWWGNDPVAKENTDIDVVADNKQDGQIILGKCKWRNEPTDAADIMKLISKAHLISGYDEYQYMFFSKSPYTEAAKQIAREKKNLELVTLDLLYSSTIAPHLR